VESYAPWILIIKDKMPRGKTKKSLHDNPNDARLFSSMLELDHRRHISRRNPNCNAEKDNIKIIEKLLSEFSMEATIKKYRTMNAVEVKIDPSQSSINSSAATERLRDRLIQLMGTDVVRINDRTYTEKLSRKLQEEHEGLLVKKEKELAKAEEDRLRRLMLEGVITIDEELLGEKKSKSNKKKGDRRKKRKHNLTGKTKRSDSQENEERATPDEKFDHSAREDPVTTQMEVIDKSTKTKKKINVRKSATLIKSKSKERPISRDSQFKLKIEDKQQRIPESKKTTTPDIKTDDGEDQKSPVSTPRTSRPVSRNPVHDALRQQETVRGLYEVANRMVPL